MRNNFINRQFKYSYHHATVILIAINVFMFILTNNYPRLLSYLALNPINVRFNHAYWQFITYMFVHANFSHLFNNMLSLLIFSVALERSIGTKEYVLYYMFTGVFAGLASYITFLLTGSWFTYLLGASGAVYAVLLLFAVVFPSARVFIFGLIPIRAPVLVAFYFIVEFSLSVVGANDGIAHYCHLFGLLFGLIYIKVRMRMKPLRRWGLL